MCGRFTTALTGDEIAAETGLSPPADWAPRYNLAPSQKALALRQSKGGGRELALLTWGLIPAWASDATIGRKLAMARSETVDQKPAFRDAFFHQRCAIVADGFYEWTRRNGVSQPMYFRFTRPLWLAGIWQRWRKYQNDVETFALMTTAANLTMRTIHDRMPVLLDAAACAQWIGADTGAAALHALLCPAPDDALRVFAVGREVNNPKNDYPALLGEYHEEATLFGG